MEIRTARLCLREFRAGDLAELAAYQRDGRFTEVRGAGAGAPSCDLLESFIAWAGQEPRRNWQLAIALGDGVGDVVGCAGLRGEGWPADEAEFGIELAAEHWGQGIAGEAARAMLGAGFGELGMARVHAVSIGTNARVAAVLERLGFARVSDPPGLARLNRRPWSQVQWAQERNDWLAGT